MYLLLFLFVLCDECLHLITISTASYFKDKQRTALPFHYSCPHRVPWKKREDCFVCCIVCGKGLIWHYHLGAYCIMHHYSSPTLIHYIKLGKLSLSVSLSPFSCFISRFCCLEPTVLLTVLCYCCVPLALCCCHSTGCSCSTWKNSVTKWNFKTPQANNINCMTV